MNMRVTDGLFMEGTAGGCKEKAWEEAFEHNVYSQYRYAPAQTLYRGVSVPETAHRASLYVKRLQLVDAGGGVGAGGFARG